MTAAEKEVARRHGDVHMNDFHLIFLQVLQRRDHRTESCPLDAC
jgi:hypothetical protein